MQLKFNSIFKLYFLIIPAFILDTSAAQGIYNFIQVGIKEGLSQSSVLCIFQDSQGYMWFGTGNGLNKYDGYNFTVFTHDPRDSSSISDNGIKVIIEDENGYLWIGTSNGILNKFDRKTGIFTHYNIANLSDWFNIEDEKYYDYPVILTRNLINSSITTIIEDDFGDLWIGTWGKGLVKLNKATGELKYFYRFNSEKGLSSNKISSLYKDHLGNIWIGTFGGGLNQISISELIKGNKDFDYRISFNHYKHIKDDFLSLSDNRVTSIYEDRKFNILVGTFGGGLNIIKINNDNKLSFNNPLLLKNKNAFSKIMSICEDEYGTIWLGSFEDGIGMLNIKTDSFRSFTKETTLQRTFPIKDVLSIYCDKSGIIWAGSHLGNGIVKIEKELKRFHLVRKGDKGKGLNDKIVWSIFEDDKNNLWIGTYKGGLNKFNRKTKSFSYFVYNSAKNSISGNHVRAIVKDNFNTLWVGTYAHGLNRYDLNKDKWYSYKFDPDDFNSISANQIQSIFIQSDSIMWIGTFGGGLCRTVISGDMTKKIKFERFMHDPSNPMTISDDRVYTIYKDRENIMWIGTFGGLNSFDLKKYEFKRYVHEVNNKKSLSDNRVISISRNIKGDLLVGTYGGGLNVLDSAKGYFSRYTYKDGLTSDAVYSALSDNNKNLWLSTDNGLFKLDQLHNRFTHYDVQDGIQSKEFSGGAYFKNSSGELFFGGINGLNYFFPDSIKDDKFQPSIVITSISVMGRELKGEHNNLKLNYNQNFISFRFSSLDYYNPIKNLYRFKLEGLEDNWNTTDANYRFASYTNLSPGNYIFKVQGTNSDGIWTPNEAFVNITILTPFWMTWWFILLLVLLTGGFITYFINQRIHHVIAIEKLKSKLSADLHDNIGAGLTEISILSELVNNDLNRNSVKAKEKLINISNLSRSLIDNMSDIVWVVNPKRDTLHDLITRLKDTYNEILREKGINFKITNLELIKSIKLPLDFKQNLYLILKEALNNSIKHSRGNKISLEIALHKNNIEISITDNGIGFNPNNKFNGNGLKNMKNRANSIGGMLTILTNEQTGTTIKFSGRIKKRFIQKN